MIKAITIDTRQATHKGQKLIAALFLVTDHLSDTEPFRLKVRTLAVGLLDTEPQRVVACAGALQALIASGSIAKIISEKNATILHNELGYFADLVEGDRASIGHLFPLVDSDKGQLQDKRTFSSNMSFITPKRQNNETVKSQSFSTEQVSVSKESKSIRQEKILSFITTRKSANIKDISALFPDVSEKTIQRELGWLVASGKVTKRGDKRWSLYLAVS